MFFYEFQIHVPTIGFFPLKDQFVFIPVALQLSGSHQVLCKWGSCQHLLPNECSQRKHLCKSGNREVFMSTVQDDLLKSPALSVLICVSLVYMSASYVYLEWRCTIEIFSPLAADADGLYVIRKWNFPFSMFSPGRKSGKSAIAAIVLPETFQFSRRHR